MEQLFTKEDHQALKEKDPLMKKVMETIPLTPRSLTPDLFQSLLKSIVGQQISMKAQETIWQRCLKAFPQITPKSISEAPLDTLRGLGLSGPKASYLKGTATMIFQGTLDLETLPFASDEEVIEALTKLPGIGPWTAEMVLIFTLGRKDVLSYGDLAIKRGLMMLYGHDTLSKKQFQYYKQLFSPQGTLAALYLWEISSGRYDLDALKADV